MGILLRSIQKKMKLLTLPEAYHLYLMIKPVFPEIEDIDENDMLGFLREIIINSRDSDVPVIRDILELLSDGEADKIIEKGTVYILNFLLENLIENGIVRLVGFFDGVITNA